MIRFNERGRDAALCCIFKWDWRSWNRPRVLSQLFMIFWSFSSFTIKARVQVPVETASQLRAKNGSSQRLFHTLLAEGVSCDFPNRSRLHQNNNASCWHTVIYKPLYRRERRSSGTKKKKVLKNLTPSTKIGSKHQQVETRLCLDIKKKVFTSYSKE